MKKTFICATKECCSFDKFISAPYLRKSFVVDDIPEKAEISICGLGFYLIYINGKNITKGAFAPYISNPNHLCYYDTYNISNYLVKGKNTIGIILGNGFYNPLGGAIWDFDKADWINSPCVALELKLDDEVVIEADQSFKVHNSPIIFDELRMGEYYDANLEIKDWNMPSFDDSSWDNALMAPTPKGELVKCNAEPIVVTKVIKPIKIIPQDDGYVYDFGENNSGVCTLKIKASKCQIIEFSHGEVMTDGKFDNYSTIFDGDKAWFYPESSQKDKYIAKGEGIEEYTPSFTYHGFRYVLVKGITKEQATKDLLTYKVMSSDLKEIGGFTCSDEIANTLFEMVKRSDRSNFYYFPTDCPHREKNGWTADASLSAPHMSLLYDVEKSFAEWLKNIRLAQNEIGQYPCIVPTYSFGYEWGSGPAWDTVLFNLTYEVYKKRGNTQIIKDNAKAMIKYFDYIETKRNQDGTVSIGLGDWCPIGKSEHQYKTPIEVTNTIVLMDMANKATEMLTAIGDKNANRLKEIYFDYKNIVRNILLNKDTMSIKGDTQTGQAMALYYGVFDESEEQKAFENLMQFIKENDNNFDCGCLGMHVLFHVLSDFGYADLAYNMITKKDFPSYAYLIEKGETTLIEMFRDDNPRRGSHNHHFFGDIARWFITSVAGLNVIDCNTVLIKPNFIEKIDYASAYYELPLGRVSVSWKRSDNIIYIYISYNMNIKYDVILPDGYSKENVKIVAKGR